ncbi:MAG: hypothetical protein WKF76_11830 [Nocardioidaceae bacterium]
MRRDERRQVAAQEARAIKDDAVDLAEIRAIQEDIAALQGEGVRGEVYRLPARGRGHEQQGPR